MNLNTVRLEGFWGCSPRIYDLADRSGILLMAGFSCQWEWPEYLGKPQDDETFGMAKDSDDTLLLGSYLRDQVRWLRHHPSVFVWVLGSDKLPWPNAERHYRELLGRWDPTRPSLMSCKSLKSPVSGPSAVKMAGPYDYVTPNYWFEDRTRGGAFGFNTETGPGPQVPPIASLRKMIPADKLWPINEEWNYHCARHSFGTLDKFLTAYNQRYGAARSAEELAFKAQASNYEAMRAMFDAFGTNRGEATGVIQWMLNGAWPKMFWQLYDAYLMPNGAFYGARKACQSLNAVYQVREHAVYLLNETLAKSSAAKLRVTLLDADSKVVFSRELDAACPANSSRKALPLPALDPGSPVYFLNLELVDAKGASLARNFYWLSSKADVLDPSKADWTFTPNQAYADFTALDRLPKTDVKLESRFTAPGTCEITLTNTSDRVAFFLELQLERDGETLAPVLWDDNYVSLMPRETRTLRARFDGAAGKPRPVMQGWNLQSR
jgi:exo-1,4-beta-D-glucosaminidase